MSRARTLCSDNCAPATCRFRRPYSRKSSCARSRRCGGNPVHQAHPLQQRRPAELETGKLDRRPERRAEDLMEAQPAPAAPGVAARLSSQLNWYCTLSPPGRAAFWATVSGWALDAYNQMTLGFVLPTVTTAFALSTTQAGLLGTVGGVTSAIGGALAGALADTIGRVQVLLLSIGVRGIHLPGRL